MSNKIKGKSRLKKKEISGKSRNEEALEKIDRKFTVSFKDLDKRQGQTFEDWNEEGLLVNMLNTLLEYCKKTMQECKGEKFKAYGSFPPRTNFKHPAYIPQDVNWASLHLNSRACLGGYIYENVFNVVFLDKNHEFWICEKKHT